MSDLFRMVLIKIIFIFFLIIVTTSCNVYMTCPVSNGDRAKASTSNEKNVPVDADVKVPLMP